jgi:hypothetical protein
LKLLHNDLMSLAVNFIALPMAKKEPRAAFATL